jgi:hypothetical protein
VPHPLCARRIHEWGEPDPDGRLHCTRKGCPKVKGQRLTLRRRQEAAAAASPPERAKLSLVPGPAKVAPAHTPAAPAGGLLSPPASRPAFKGLSGAAERMARARGLVPREPTQVEKTAAAATQIEKVEEKPKEPGQRESITDWIKPAIPNLVVNSGKWSVRRLSREPWEPDKVWYGRWRKCYESSLERHLPEIEIGSGWALIIATFFLWLSMFWAAKPRKKDEAPQLPPKPATDGETPAAPPKPTPKMEGTAWETNAPRPRPADTHPSANASATCVSLFGLTNPSSPPETSLVENGDAKSATPSA